MTGPLGTGVQLNGFVFVGVSATVFANVEIDAMDSIGIGAVAITNVKSGEVIPGNHTAKSVKDVTSDINFKLLQNSPKHASGGSK